MARHTGRWAGRHCLRVQGHASIVAPTASTHARAGTSRPTWGSPSSALPRRSRCSWSTAPFSAPRIRINRQAPHPSPAPRPAPPRPAHAAHGVIRRRTHARTHARSRSASSAHMTFGGCRSHSDPFSSARRALPPPLRQSCAAAARSGFRPSLQLSPLNCASRYTDAVAALYEWYRREPTTWLFVPLLRLSMPVSGLFPPLRSRTRTVPSRACACACACASENVAPFSAPAAALFASVAYSECHSTC